MARLETERGFPETQIHREGYPLPPWGVFWA
jgi:hypothetical protein